MNILIIFAGLLVGNLIYDAVVHRDGVRKHGWLRIMLVNAIVAGVTVLALAIARHIGSDFFG
jgi:hypothetical protein